MATRGEMMSPSTDPLSRISTLSLAVTLPIDLAKHDHRLGEHLRLDFAVGTNRQHVLAQLDRALDVALDGEVLAAVQLALDDDRFSDVHDISLHVVNSIRTRSGVPVATGAGGCGAAGCPLAGRTASSRFHM